MLKTRFFIILAVLLTIYSSHGTAQGWSSPIISSSVSGIIFEWRRLKYRETHNLTLIEWKFINTTDSTIVCTYYFQSNREEERIGKITLKPHGEKLSGWYFAGEELRGLQFTRVAFYNTSQKPP